mmetsp:Transcript_14048/g.31854  ORF Transcript_14048/g.31854 Transcript_14048/m.31854 type:complete len:628 (+) Transcript_14048:219-2102(+)
MTSRPPSSHPLYEALEYLRDNNSERDYFLCLESLEQLLQNIKDNPDDERYRNFSPYDPDFEGRIGFLIGSENVMSACGFKFKKKKDKYCMPASEEAWHNLLHAGMILYETLEEEGRPSSSSSPKRKKKSKSSKSVNSGSSSRTGSSSKKSSKSSSSKKKRHVERASGEYAESYTPSSALRAAGERAMEREGTSQSPSRKRSKRRLSTDSTASSVSSSSPTGFDDEGSNRKLKKSSSGGSRRGHSSYDSSPNHSGHDDDYDVEDDEEEQHRSSAMARWMKKQSSGSGRRAGFSKSDSQRSFDSKGSSRSGRPGLGDRANSGSKKSVMSRAEKKLVREQSKLERRERKLMEKEEKEIKATRRRLLERRIKEEGGPRWTFLLQVVTILTLAELGLDLGTTIISFISLIGSFDCCGQIIEVGTLTLGVTIPYFCLIVIEFIILGCSVRQARANSARDRERMKKIDNVDEEWFDDTASWASLDAERTKFNFGKIIHYVLIANPFLGALITWTLLYEVSSRREAFVMLGLEGGALLLMFIGLWFERHHLNCCSLIVHATPLLPFAGICAVVWYYLQRGGICFRDGSFWFDNCGLCGPNDPIPDSTETCPDGSSPYQGTFCGEIVGEQFCYFSY